MTELTLTGLLNELWECPGHIEDEEIRLWYSWLFEGTNADISIPLWESACKGKERILLDQTTFEVIRCYCSEQLSCSRPEIPADDIRIELEFFLQLLTREKYEKAAHFYREHLRDLTLDILGKIKKYSRCEYYISLADQAGKLFETIDQYVKQPERLKKLDARLPERQLLVPAAKEEIE